MLTYLTLEWRSYSTISFSQLSLERKCMGLPIKFHIQFNSSKLYRLRSAHAHKKSGETFAQLVWLGTIQRIPKVNMAFYGESSLILGNGAILSKIDINLHLTTNKSWISLLYINLLIMYKKKLNYEFPT